MTFHTGSRWGPVGRISKKQIMVVKKLAWSLKYRKMVINLYNYIILWKYCRYWLEMRFKFVFWGIIYSTKLKIKGSNRQWMVVELRLQYCREFFRIHLRNIKRFKDLKLLSLSEKTTFKIINLGVCTFWKSILFVII